MVENALYTEAKRVKERALSKYPPGRTIIASFRNRGGFRKEIRYVNPVDIPLVIYRYYTKLYLWTVHKAEEMITQDIPRKV